ncbi:MAG: hypothetical protein QF752_00260 [Planctomycetota bacterium]|nr:hypothetical protein [Planctomycetota bacterium]
MRIGDAQKGLRVFNVILFLGLGGIGGNMFLQEKPQTKTPEERPLIQAKQRQAMTQRDFEQTFGVCWSWVPKPVAVKPEVREVVRKELPKNLPIKILELNSAGSEKLRHIVFEYTGAAPGGGDEGMGQQRIHQYVFAAKPFLLSDGRRVKLISVVKDMNRAGAYFEIDGKEKRFVTYTPLSGGLEGTNGKSGSEGTGRRPSRGPGRSSSVGSGPSRSSSMGGRPKDNQTRKLAPNRWQIGRADWEDAYENRQQYLSEVKLAVLQDQKSGEILGLQLQDAGSSTLAYRYGFRNKDIVRKIMGQPVTSVDDFYRIMEENTTASSAVIEVERSGRRMQIQFQFSP